MASIFRRLGWNFEPPILDSVSRSSSKDGIVRLVYAYFARPEGRSRTVCNGLRYAHRRVAMVLAAVVVLVVMVMVVVVAVMMATVEVTVVVG